MRLRTIATHNLLRRKARAAFLVAGLLIGVGTVVTLDLAHAVDDRPDQGRTCSDYGANIVISPRSKEVALSYGGISAGGLSLGSRSLDQSVLKRIDAIPARRSISVVAPELVGPVKVRRAARAADGRAARGPVQAQALVVGRARTGAGQASRDGGRLRRRQGARPHDGRLREDSAAAASPSPGSSSRPAPRTTSCWSPTFTPPSRCCEMPGKLTLVEVSAQDAGAPVETIVRAARGGAAAGQGRHHAGGGQEPRAGREPVQQLQLRHRRPWWSPSRRWSCSSP